MSLAGLESTLLWAGLAVAGLTLAGLVWSALIPARRIWPPEAYGPLTPYAVWSLTGLLAGALIGLGVLGWGGMGLPQWVRYGAGGLLIVLGNLAVWAEVAAFGFRKTSGAEGGLRTDGLYRVSRHPQYVADVAMVTGWCLLAASAPAALPGAGVVLVLLAAPLAEEPWLEERHGAAYRRYKARVRRYL
ncbi:MAG: methyltransferase [Roseovarius sp.]